MRDDYIEKKLIENHPAYLKDKENLYYAKKGIKLLGETGEERVESQGEENKGTIFVRGTTSGTSISRAQGKGRTIAKRIRNTFIETGGLYLTGTKVTNPSELAELLQIYRNPYFETFRMIYMKGDQIVGVQGTSCFLPGLCLIVDPKETRKEFKQRIESTMKRLAADGYYMTHNHPSGNVKASFEDKIETFRFQTGIDGFLGHIITDHTHFTLLDKDTEEVLPISEEFQIPVYEKVTGVSTILDKTITSPEEVAKVAKMLDTERNISTVAFVDSLGRINEVAEVSNSFVKSIYFPTYLEETMKQGGNTTCFLITEDESVYYESFSLVEKQYIRDLLLMRGQQSINACDEGIMPKPNYLFAGKEEKDLPFFSYLEESQPKFNQQSVRESIWNRKKEAEIQASQKDYDK